MATRSRIGIVTEEWEIKSAYCHCDGYPEHNGQALLDHYFNKDQIAILLSDGYVSSIKTETGEIERINSEVLVFDGTIKGFLESSRQCWAEYAYLFVDGFWIGWQLKNDGWHELREIEKQLPR